jgi:histidine triad (HIT) family protein
MPADCPFCAILVGDLPASVIEQDDAAVAFLDVNPMTRGHTLVVPRRHQPDLYDLAPAEGAAVMAMAVRVARRQRALLEPEGVNLLHATGAAAFQTVFHVHMHVIPRWSDDGFEVHLPRVEMDRPALDDLAARLAATPI